MRLINTRYYLLFLLALCTVVGCTGRDKPKLLMYDDGKMENKFCLYDTSHAIHFKKPRGNWAIKGIRFYAMRQGSSAGIDRRIVTTICDNNVQPISEYTALHNLVSTSIEKWCPINVNPHILCPDEFWVIIDTNSSNESQIFICVDTNVKVSHSGKGNPGETPSELEGVFDWMIRVELQKLSKEELGKLIGNETPM